MELPFEISSLLRYHCTYSLHNDLRVEKKMQDRISPFWDHARSISPNGELSLFGFPKRSPGFKQGQTSNLAFFHLLTKPAFWIASCCSSPLEPLTKPFTKSGFFRHLQTFREALGKYIGLSTRYQLQGLVLPLSRLDIHEVQAMSRLSNLE